jgi:hypothetical protein
MASLNDIPKNKFFQVPDGYFERLPSKIQTRLSQPERHRATPGLRFALAYALPVLIILSSVVYFYTPASPSTDDILATVETQVMLEYLQESVLTTDEVLEAFDWSSEELESIERDIYDVALPDADTINLDL